ncbi:MAG TPA: protein translocase subunit SecF [Sulfurovum sp.]|jgi:preprotein translocase subunit SecF|nr:MAG: protein translocase subunit SecF [Sulfurovum sp. 35-42-20]OYY56326.1 MAG: protein translocase subunit SecF [Sulfurovum sp. 28-43-6]OYZ25804.1 MAG: protein translocase subunit SecF [Sulfurovum sp. 16-42-52]OYZ49047.1 MAG: protein translocase subunit SecF [Sulfurovum sp. 24-42-9]OZA45184.1 MAG: protein translocase subunit SecF [Sulfurovum sp. 17-42-90]OZA59853.1 MAG: protein translocase subunit SecF [Sulfurovum sp. 39-42-12]HQR73984.1 protein translocase subunit SecF [Sulfurovum sp.]
MELFKYTKPMSLMSKSKRFGLLSLTVFALALVVLFTKGLNYGIDFAGGTLIQVKYETKAPINEVREALKANKEFESASVTFFGSDEEIVIRSKVSSGALGVDVGDTVRGLLQDTGTFEVRRVDMVGAAVGSELREQGLLAMVLSLLGILIYVSIRFEWRFALASILALVHDATITMGLIAFFEFEVNLDILAAILTLLGYSINDTIIVFDRIREGINTVKDSRLETIIDESVTRTLSRTTLTSMTTFLVILTLYLFGGEIIHGFSFTLLVGVIIGTYSSIFVASPILMWLGFSASNYREKEAAKLKREKEKEKMRAMYESGTL